MGEISKEMLEKTLRWFDHVTRREEGYVGKRMMVSDVRGTRKRDRPRQRWEDKQENGES